MNVTISSFSFQQGHKLVLWGESSSNEESSSSEESSFEEICISRNPSQWVHMCINHDNYRRYIFISPSGSTSRLVAKLELGPLRLCKLELTLPHAEEIAYKICKIFHWNTIPKTKVLHQYSLPYENRVEKRQKYAELMKGFHCPNYPITFTFQAFVEGKNIHGKTLDPSLSSYQKAYLLGMVLGKFDAHGDNILFNEETREFFEIDNEYIGERNYAKNGVLNHYKELKQEEISPEMLDDLLNTSVTQFTKIQNKYNVRDVNLIALWANEPIQALFGYNDRARSNCWSRIMENFIFLKMGILTLRECKTPVTIENLETNISSFRRHAHGSTFHCNQEDYLLIIEALIKAGFIDKVEDFSMAHPDMAMKINNFRLALLDKYNPSIL